MSKCAYRNIAVGFNSEGHIYCNDIGEWVSLYKCKTCNCYVESRAEDKG